MQYYCLKIELPTDVINYLNRIGVSIVPEKINNEMYLRLDCPEGTQEEDPRIVNPEKEYRVRAPRLPRRDTGGVRRYRHAGNDVPGRDAITGDLLHPLFAQAEAAQREKSVLAVCLRVGYAAHGRGFGCNSGQLIYLLSWLISKRQQC